MSATAAVSDRPRRTQEERRTATRRALLDASLACLLEDGYAGLTTRRVAARAGVSPATQRFYFPNRAAFVAAAVERLAIELVRQQRGHPMRSAPAGQRFGAWLDELWEICNGPAFQVITELTAAARTDANARHGLETAGRALTRQIAVSAADLFPEQIADRGFRALIDLATASMRGLAMFLPVTDRDELDRRWQAAREQLMRLHQGLVEKSA